MIPILALIALAVAGFIVVFRTIRLLLPWLTRLALDQPNARSLHVAPTPRGGGIAWLLGLLPAWGAVMWYANPEEFWRFIPVPMAALLLAAVSFIDDVRGLPIAPRLGAQGLAVVIGLTSLPAAGTLFQGWLPLAADRLVLAILWVWFINLFNFMDGIDGLGASESAAVGAGVALVAILAPHAAHSASLGLGLTLMGTAFGFLVWNWQPARVFLGDVGSIPLGFLIGWLLLDLALRGLWAVALLLPAYYLADASVTLLHRLGRGQPIWVAHRDHCYQRAVQAGCSHAGVSVRVALLNIVLLALAGVSVYWPDMAVGALLVAALLVGAQLWRFATGKWAVS